MFKKFNYNLNHNPVGAIWGISLVMSICSLFVLTIFGQTFIDKSQLIIILLGYGTIFNLGVATYILIKGDIQPVNVTYICPTARKYMNEREIKEIEKVEE